MSSLDCSFLASCFSRSFTSASCLAFMSFSVTSPEQGTQENRIQSSTPTPCYMTMTIMMLAYKQCHSTVIMCVWMFVLVDFAIYEGNLWKSYYVHVFDDRLSHLGLIKSHLATVCCVLVQGHAFSR